MRDKIRVLYYPDMIAEETTLKKAILFFDEVHFMDRPSFSFEGGLGTIGAQSPWRPFLPLFERDNVNIFIHEAPSGRLYGDPLDQIAADINDPRFLTLFQYGLRTSATFCGHHIAKGKYADSETGETCTDQDIVKLFSSIDTAAITKSHESAFALLTDEKIKPFSHSNETSLLKTFVFEAAVCSAKMNSALSIGSKEGFIPFADAIPYGSLLSSKYSRAVDVLAQAGERIPLTDLSFAIFDELVPGEVLAKLRIEDVIRYRHESDKAREEFLEYLSWLQQKIGEVRGDVEYIKAIENMIQSEIFPAARNYRNKMQDIYETIFGSIGKGAVGAVGMAGGVQIFGDLSLTKIMALIGIASAYVGKTALDALVAQRSVTRECALSFVLSLDR